MKRDSSLVRVVAHVDLGGQRFRLRDQASDIHLQCRPGQFFNLAFSDGAPYLPRPFSVYEIIESAGQIDFLIACVGQGTRKLAQTQVGDSLLMVGPLGQGFPLQEAACHIFVAGSIGLAPFIELHKALRRQNSQIPHSLIYGARNREELVDLDFLEAFDWTVLTCTDDGSSGVKGRVTDLIHLKNYPEDSIFYTCGPTPMMRSVAQKVAKYPKKLWVSMEEQMACGIGICKGCVIYNPQTPPPLPTICKEGPIFEASKIFGDPVVADQTDC